MIPRKFNIGENDENMSLSDIISNYIDSDSGTILKIGKRTPIRSKKLFYKVLNGWCVYNGNKTDITIGNDKYKGTPTLWFKIDGTYYKLNSDTKMSSVLEFLSNQNNSWTIIPNRDGKMNLVTNNLDGEKIKGFYFYKD
jgi:hypothetical protein